DTIKSAEDFSARLETIPCDTGFKSNSLLGKFYPKFSPHLLWRKNIFHFLTPVLKKRSIQLARKFIVGAAIFSILLYAGIKFASDPSINPPKEMSPPQTGLQLTFWGLYAPSREQCIIKIMNGEAMEQKLLKQSRNVISIKSATGLCGIKIQNESRHARWIKLGNLFSSLVIAGDHPFKQGGNLHPHMISNLIFSKRPPVGPLEIFVPTTKNPNAPNRIIFLIGKQNS
ncbi:MAG: hypothetical protein L3J46_05230, partial [Kangiellaceae bacterium]|nr:hypothetical protein [Kangiellaceae bacterium]